MVTILQAIDRFDRRLFLTFNKVTYLKLRKVMAFITIFGGLIFQSILAMILMIFQTTRNLGFKLAFIQIVVTLIVQILKAKVARIRPYHALEGIIPIKIERDFSFPSGHTAASFTTALVISSVLPAFAFLSFSFAILIGCSRVYLGVHYPTDVLVGSACGLGITTLMILLGV